MNYEEYTVQVYENGDKLWYQNGNLHRTDGPAIEEVDGYKAWYQNGNLHRTDGPAVEWANGHKAWYLEGKELSEEEFLSRGKTVKFEFQNVRFVGADEERYNDLLEWGYIKPEKLLVRPSQAKKVREAIETIKDFLEQAKKEGILVSH